MKYVFLMVLITLSASFVTLMKSKTLLKPNILFSLLWTFGSYFVNSNFVGLHDLSRETNVYMLITIITFNIFYLLFSIRKVKKLDLQVFNSILDLEQHWGKIVLANISLILITLPYFAKMLIILFTRSFYEVRVAAYTYSTGNDILVSKVIFLLMFSLFNLLLIITSLKIILGKIDLKLFYLMSFDTLYFTIITGSRNFLAKFFVFLFLSFIFANANLIKKRFVNPKIFGIGAIVLIILDRAIKARSLSSLSPIENIITYQFGGISYFDHIIHNPNFIGFNQVQLYGLGTFAWLISPIVYLLSTFKLVPNITAEAIIGKVTENGIYISDRFNFNALTTAMYPMWRDYGTIGIVLGMAMFGFIVAKSEKSFLYKRNIKMLLCFFSFYIAVFESTQLYDMLYLRFSIQILWIYLLFGKTKILIKLK